MHRQLHTPHRKRLARPLLSNHSKTRREPPEPDRPVSDQAPGADRAWGARWLPLLIAAPFVLAAFLPILFDVIRDIPPSWDCGESPAFGHARAVASYKSGYEVLHGLTLFASLFALLALSVARKRRAGEGGIGMPTFCVSVVFGVAALLALLGTGAAGVGVVPALLPAAMLVFPAAALGPQLTGLIAVGLIAWAGVRATLAAATPGRLEKPSALCWGVFVLTAGHAVVVSHQGHGPLFC